jgi:DHA1 family bicyclomycin/chloramphenicol resistance-like MFS transporter
MKAEPPPIRIPLLLLIGLVAFGPLSTDVYLPALPAIGTHFAADPAQVQLTLSVFLVGFAISMLAYGPLSDRFGRRPVLLGALGLYTLASVACMLAPSIEALIVARFFQALGGCAGPVLGRAIVRDVHGAERSAQVLSTLAVAMALAPAIGPILGGLLTESFGWAANFALLSAFGLVVLLGTIALLPETNRQLDPTALRPLQLLSNYRSLLRHRRYVGYVGVVACGYGAIFAFISGASFALIVGLGIAPSVFGFCFSVAVLGFMAGSFLASRLHGRLDTDAQIRLGTWLALAGGAAAAGLAWGGLHTVASVVAPVVVVFLACGLMLPNSMARGIGPFPRMAGAASALMGFIQMAFAATVGILVGLFQDGSPHAMATAIALCGLGAALFYALMVHPAEETAAAPGAAPLTEDEREAAE